MHGHVPAKLLNKDLGIDEIGGNVFESLQGYDHYPSITFDD